MKFILVLFCAASTLAGPDCMDHLVTAREWEAGLDFTRLCIAANPSATKAFFAERDCQGSARDFSEECDRLAEPVMKCIATKRGMVTAAGEFDDAKLRRLALGRAGEARSAVARAMDQCGPVKGFNLHKYSKCISQKCVEM